MYERCASFCCFILYQPIFVVIEKQPPPKKTKMTGWRIYHEWVDVFFLLKIRGSFQPVILGFRDVVEKQHIKKWYGCHPTWNLVRGMKIPVATTRWGFFSAPREKNGVLNHHYKWPYRCIHGVITHIFAELWAPTTYPKIRNSWPGDSSRRGHLSLS